MKIAIVLLCAAACAAPLPRPDEPGAREAYRSELAQGQKGPRARQARERLERAEYDDARSAHSIFAYRRFLDEFPDSHKAAEVRALLEGLRWAEAERHGTEAAWAGFLADEPSGPHAGQAWARLSAARLERVLQEGSAAALRGWLAQDPAAAGAERARAALDELDYRDAADPELLRAYLSGHPDGAHRKEAEARLERAAVDEALLLEDELRLRALNEPSADKLAYERAAALLDEGRLALLARRGGPFAARAAQDLAALRRDTHRAAALESAAHRLFLPRATLDELPQAGPARALALLAWARALDGGRLQRILAEVASPKAHVALAAVDAAEALLAGLPRAEAAVRAERALLALRPIAQAAPQLVQVALLERALGKARPALEAAREAASRDPRSAPAAWLAAQLEEEAGEPAVVLLAAQALRSQATWLAAAHAEAAQGGDASAAHELCAAARAGERAAALLKSPEAQADALSLRRRAEEAQRSAAVACEGDGARPESSAAFAALAGERRLAARELAAARSSLAEAALARAAARDPDPAVRAEALAARASLLR